MGTPASSNQRLSLVIGIAIAAILIASFFVFLHLRSNGVAASISSPSTTQGYFSDDDGATTFEADLTNIPPFVHNGKEAVRAYVFVSKGQKFVAYLERYSPEAKARLANIKNEHHDPLEVHRIQNAIVPEVKNPKEASWVLRDSPAGQKAIDVVAPDGSRDNVEPVSP